MKSVTADWIKSASSDLQTIDAIIDNPDLTAVIAFHSQQCVEKCLKALLEEYGIEAIKTHNLLTLKAAVEQKHPINLDEDLLSLLNQLYIGSRYPGEFGLSPTGLPTVEEAREFAQFAKEAMEKIFEALSTSS